MPNHRFRRRPPDQERFVGRALSGFLPILFRFYTTYTMSRRVITSTVGRPLFESIIGDGLCGTAVSTGGIRNSPLSASFSTRVPEDWGRDTEFLGTPSNHRDLLATRPISPHVFEVDSVTKPHYAMPYGAISSICNRVTGVALSVGSGAAGYVALTQGDLGSAIESFKEAAPLLVFPAKLCVSLPLTYHYLAGLRHVFWDHHHYGNQADRENPLKYENVEQSSKVLLLGSAGLASLISVL